jgi:Fur family ferric uptake transcriptional regulator
LLDPLEARILKDRGFHVLDHELKFYGLCQRCAPKRNKISGLPPVRGEKAR